METIVETNAGRIRGTREGAVEVFRGIPFAAPPVGPRRFQSPQPHPGWAGVRDALAFGPAALQNESPLMTLTGWAATCDPSEDCLSLNIWTPATDGAKRPVFVWIHGGAFTNGTGSQSAYDGRFLAERGDIVVVTLNYRLGAFGFLALEGLRDREGGGLGNLGLIDQVAALEWVRDNIERFGGDPAQVTLAGESAGASSASSLLASPRARPLFQRAILQSGHAFNTSWPEAMLETGERFMHEVGLLPGDVDGLLELSVEKILAGQQALASSNPDSAWCMTFQPCVDGDFVESMPIEAIASGKTADISLLAGTNLDEMKMFMLEDPAVFELDETGLIRRLDRILASPTYLDRDWSRPLMERFRAALPETPISELWWAMETDRRMRVPTLRMLEAAAAHSSRNYSYLFTWPSPAFGGLAGSCHAVEIPFVFGTLHNDWAPGLVGEGAEVDRLSDILQRSWLAFVRSGSPAVPELEGWEAYAPDTRITGVLGAECHSEKAPLEAQRAAWDDIAEGRDRWTLERLAHGDSQES